MNISSIAPTASPANLSPTSSSQTAATAQQEAAKEAQQGITDGDETGSTINTTA